MAERSRRRHVWLLGGGEAGEDGAAWDPAGGRMPGRSSSGKGRRSGWRAALETPPAYFLAEGVAWRRGRSGVRSGLFLVGVATLPLMERALRAGGRTPSAHSCPFNLMSGAYLAAQT